MLTDLDHLVTETIAATGADAPALLADDSPALSLADERDRPVYLIGLIGGKDVGKSSLVNALVGLPISAVTSHGAGTEIVVAYAHTLAAPAVEALLSREVPGRFKIVTHDNAALGRQVLLDLPDIDSVYADHIETTRKMLRHMLYPIWLQSIEKYADQQPQRWLARVAEGNDPANFLFAINKVDLLASREGENAVQAVRDLTDDFARRVTRTLSLPDWPKVFAIAATSPYEFDLPSLRQKLSHQRPSDEVEASHQLAGRRRATTLLSWLSTQNLADRAQRAGRLAEEAEEIIADRLLAPILESAVPKLLDDAGYRARLTEPAIRRRLARWPVVNAINAVLSPAMSFAQRSLSASAAGSDSAAIDALLHEHENNGSMSDRISAAFAHVNRLHPDVGRLFRHRKLWEPPAAVAAAADLKQRLRGAADRQRQAILTRAGGRDGFVAPIWRWLLTVGAILWFPIVQPVTSALLAGTVTQSATEIIRLIVNVLSSYHLLQSVSFLLLWFVVLWMMLRWHTQRRAERLIRRWMTDESLDPLLSFAAQAVEWTDDLLSPLRSVQERFESLAEREDEIRKQIGLDRAAAA